MSQAETGSTTEPPSGGNTLPEVALVERGGEPRALDTDIGERLGMARATNIRALIEANRAELEGFGNLHSPRANSGSSGRRGRPAEKVYYLNEEQSLLISAISKAPNAPAVRAMLIRTFVAWRRGHLVPAALDERTIGGINKGVVRKAISDLVPDMLADALNKILPGMVEQQLEADSRAVAVGYKPALAVLEERKVPPRRRRAFSQKVSARLRRFSTEKGHPYRISRETGRYLFHVDVIAAWLAAEGDALIRTHIANMAGQGVLPFSPRPVRP